MLPFGQLDALSVTTPGYKLSRLTVLSSYHLSFVPFKRVLYNSLRFGLASASARRSRAK